MTDVNPLLNVDALLDLLDDLEWSLRAGLGSSCPCCKVHEDDEYGHLRNCRLQAALVAWGRRPAPEAPNTENEAQIASQGDSEPNQCPECGQHHGFHGILCSRAGDGCEHRRLRGLSNDDPGLRGWLAGKGKL